MEQTLDDVEAHQDSGAGSSDHDRTQPEPGRLVCWVDVGIGADIMTGIPPGNVIGKEISHEFAA